MSASAPDLVMLINTLALQESRRSLVIESTVTTHDVSFRTVADP
jgi:hypothetical protein